MSLSRAASKGYEPPLPDVSSGDFFNFYAGDTHTDSTSNFSWDVVRDTDLKASDTTFLLIAADNADNSYGLYYDGNLMTVGVDDGSASPQAIQASISGQEGVPGSIIIDSLSGSAWDYMSMISFTVDMGWGLDSTTTAFAGTGMPNPPSVTGVTTDEYIVIVGFLDDDSDTATAPSGFTMFQEAFTGVGSSIYMAYATGLSGTVDPGAFGGVGDDAWRAHTMRFSPV